MDTAVIERSKMILKKFRAGHADTIEVIATASPQFYESCRKIERSWSGSFAGWHGRMYFRNFEIPPIGQKFSGEWGGVNGLPSGWSEKQPEEVRAKIEQLVGNAFSAEKFEHEVQKLRAEAEEFKSDISLSLAALNVANMTSKEKEVLKEIDSYDFGTTKGEYVHAALPGTMMSRDTEALRQGTCVASWLYYEAVAIEGEALCKSLSKLISLCDRLIRMMEMKSSSVTPRSADSLTSLHPDVISKCRELYEKGVYSEAVEKSFKIVRDRLRKLTGYETGSEAFGKGKLHIEGAAAINVDQDFNDAVKFLTMAIDRFRNEKSHTSDAKMDDPVRAYEYLRLSSLALHLLANTTILSSVP